MIRLLQKYQQWLVCFFASLLLVVFSSVVFAQEATVSASEPSVDVTNANANYAAALTHGEGNFYE
jgi:hypothetical protein